jgi:Tfp pilus assembly protein PilN
MRAVNLLPRGDDVRRTDGPNLIVLVSVLAAVLLTAILAGGFLMEHSKAAEKQRALDDKKAELSAIPKPPAAQTAADQLLLTDKNQRVVALSTALSHRVAWDRIFRELSQVLPSDVWLNQLTANAPVSSAAGQTSGAAPAAPAAPGSATTATGFILQGYTYSHDAVARLLSRLALVPDLKDVQLQSSVATTVRGRQIVTFQIGGNISSSGSG